MRAVGKVESAARRQKTRELVPRPWGVVGTTYQSVGTILLSPPPLLLLLLLPLSPATITTAAAVARQHHY